VKKGKVSILNKELFMSADVFFQSNAALLEKVIEKLLEVKENVDENSRIADLYCGVATFATFFREKFERIDLVEENKSALSLARENVRGKNIEYTAFPSDEWVKMLPKKTEYGFIIVDPPRQGLSPLLRSWLSKSGPPVLAYLSCDPATLARDTRELLQGIYKIEEIIFYDFYPQTAHIESLLIFRQKN
jgi:23S rRNA (uracil1939-C5)-methyltransferase